MSLVVIMGDPGRGGSRLLRAADSSRRRNGGAPGEPEARGLVAQGGPDAGATERVELEPAAEVVSGRGVGAVGSDSLGIMPARVGPPALEFAGDAEQVEAGGVAFVEQAGLEQCVRLVEVSDAHARAGAD